MSAASGEGLSVGLVCPGWPPDVGGVESHAADLAAHLIRRGHRVAALCLDGDPAREPWTTRDELRDGVRVRRMAYRYHDHAALADLVVNPRSEQVLGEWIADAGCELVHVHHATGFGLGALGAARRAGARVVVTLHDYWTICPRGQMLRADGAICDAPEAATCATCLAATWPHLMPSTGGRPRGPAGEDLADDAAVAAARTRYALDALAAVDARLVPSAEAAAVLARAGLDAARLEVCENGIDVEGLRAAVAKLRRPREPGAPLRLGVLGAVQPSKGVLELLQAFAGTDLTNLRVEVHGPLPGYHGDRSYVESVERAAAADPRVALHGPYALDRLPQILAGLEGVAAPSRWAEVHGLTAREARACGLPVLVGDVGGLRHASQGGAAGRSLAPDDRAAWASALREFATDSGLRERWSSAPPDVREAADMVDQVESAYRRVLAERR